MKKASFAILLLLFLSVSYSYGNSNLFYPYVYFPLNSYYAQATAVAIGDVNGDGRNDVAMTTSCTSSDPENGCKIHVFLQNQFGLIDDPPVKYPITSGDRPESIDIGDVNHDGKADVLVGNVGSNIQVFLQNASGGLDQGVSHLTGNSSSIRIGDLNNDGFLDVVGTGTQNTVYVLFQNSSGTLNSPVTYAVTHGGYYDQVEVGDVNNDGLTDIIVISGAGTTDIGILLQNPDGTFAGPVYYHLGLLAQVQGGAIGDINGDGLNDIVVAYGWAGPDSGIGVFLQNHTGTLDPATSYASYTGPDSVFVADVNDDGKKDVIVVHTGWERLGIYLQNANGTLMPEELYPIPYTSNYKPRGIAAGDINGDGFNDVVIASHGLVVLYNKNGPAIPNFSVSPASVNFGSVFLGNNSNQTITIYNRGTGDLIIDSISISGVNANEFSQTNDCSTVGPGASCQITATFTPIVEGVKNATLTISSNDPDTQTVQITVFSYAGPKLFHPSISFPAGRTKAEAVAIGDVNGDGRNDVAMTTGSYDDPENDYMIHVFLQNQFGQLDPQIKYPTNSSYTNRSTSVAIGDVNHDGRADVVVGNSGSNIEVFLQNASGGLAPGTSYPTVNSRRVRIGDLNNDGLLDVVGFGTNNVDIYFQNSGGTLTSPITYAVGGVDIADFNNDGLTDIIIMGDQGLGVMLQRPSGSFDPAIYYDLGENESARGMAVGDVNGDAIPDIVISYDSYDGNSGIAVFLQNTSGALDPPIKDRSYGGPVFIADVNNDGKKDIVISYMGTIAIHLQGPDGTILPLEPYPIGSSSSNPHSLSVGDINGDGLNDIVVAHDGGYLIVLYGIGGPTVPNIDVSALSVNFGSIFLRSTSSKTVTVYNRGTGTLVINSIDISGQNASEFSQTNNCSTVAARSSCQINATFTPTTEGMKTATLAIYSGDPSTPILNIAFISYSGRKLFHPYVSFPIGSYTGAVAIGDVNGDGRNDVVMTTCYNFYPENDRKILVFLQNQFGQLDQPVKYPTNSSFSHPSRSIDIGDVNHDGRADVVVGNLDSNIQVFLQNASGGLDPGFSYPTVNSYSIKIGDLNNDGLLDVVGSGNSISVFFQNVNGTLNSPATSVSIAGSWEVDVGDVNNDGLTDIIISREPGVLLQRPDGTFDSAIYYDLAGGIAVGDVNGDTLQDIVATYAYFNRGLIGVFLQNSGGSLDPGISYPSHINPQAIVIADVNNDGKKDIIVAHSDDSGCDLGALGVYLQGPDGMILPEQLYSFPSGRDLNRQGLAVGDINGDGSNDVVIVDEHYGLIVLYGRKPEPDIFVSPSSFNFGSLYVGQTSSPQTLTLSNEGLQDLNIGTIAVTGAHASEFRITSNSCSGRTFITLDTCAVTVEFSPVSPGVKNAGLIIPSNDSDTPSLYVPFSATARYPSSGLRPGSLFWSMALGNFWVYHRSNPGGGSDTLRDVIAALDITTIPGVETYRIETYKNGVLYGTTWYSISLAELRKWREVFWGDVGYGEEWITTSFDTGLVSARNPIIVGDHWITTSTGMMSGSWGWDIPLKVSLDVTVQKEESVFVSAGIYKAYRFRFVLHIWNDELQFDQTTTEYAWFVPYLGFVKSQDSFGSIRGLSLMNIRKAVVDFDGDGKTDVAIYRTGNGGWFIIPSSTPGNPYGIGWGGEASDVPVPGDYDGDGNTDLAIYRSTNGGWYVTPSSTPDTPYGIGWGNPSDIPAPGNYDGDEKTDIAIYRPINGHWYIIPSSASDTAYGVAWGGDLSDSPVPGDYDGDGKTDLAVYRTSNGVWYIIPSSVPDTSYGVAWGGDVSDKPTPGDFDGDGKTDIAVYRTGNGGWYIIPSSNPGTPYSLGWGGDASDIPVPGDYSGDGKTDIAVYRSSTGVWYIIPSSGNSPYGVGWGGDPSDVPVITNPGSYM